MEEGVVGIFFKPHGQAQPTVNDIGLMARCAMTPAVFETFREPVTAKEIQICQNNLFELYKSGERPFLWILTSTISKGYTNKDSWFKDWLNRLIDIGSANQLGTFAGGLFNHFE